MEDFLKVAGKLGCVSGIVLNYPGKQPHNNCSCSLLALSQFHLFQSHLDTDVIYFVIYVTFLQIFS